MALPILLLSTNCVGFPEQESRVSKLATGFLNILKDLKIESEHPLLVVTFKDADADPNVLNTLVALVVVEVFHY